MLSTIIQCSGDTEKWLPFVGKTVLSHATGVILIQLESKLLILPKLTFLIKRRVGRKFTNDVEDSR